MGTGADRGRARARRARNPRSAPSTRCVVAGVGGARVRALGAVLVSQACGSTGVQAENWRFGAVGGPHGNLHQQCVLRAAGARGRRLGHVADGSDHRSRRGRARQAQRLGRRDVESLCQGVRGKQHRSQREPCSAASRRSRSSSLSTPRPTSRRSSCRPSGRSRTASSMPPPTATRRRPIRSAPTSKACSARPTSATRCATTTSGPCRVRSATRPADVRIPYANNLTASLTSVGLSDGLARRVQPLRLRQRRYGRRQPANNGRYTLQIARAILSHQIDPQLQVSGRIGYEDDQFLVTSSARHVYGAGFQWNPSDRTQFGGFWEERFFGSSYAVSVRTTGCRTRRSVPARRAVSAAIRRWRWPFRPARPSSSFSMRRLPRAFRIPPSARSAIEQFLARTGLPPTLTAPVNIYGTQITLQDAQNISLRAARRAQRLTFIAVQLKSEAIAGTGDVLPPALQFGQNDNTQTGAGVGYSHQLPRLTNFAASASYSRTRVERYGAERPDVEQRQFQRHHEHPLRPEDQRLRRASPISCSVTADQQRSPDTRHCHRLRLRQPHLLGRRVYEAFYGLTGKPFQLNPGPVVLLRQPAAPARDGVPRVRAAPERGLHRRHRRGRGRQDDDRAQPPRQARPEQGRRRAARQHAARRRGHAAPGRRGVRAAGPRTLPSPTCCWRSKPSWCR